jgi:hypothetical protein
MDDTMDGLQGAASIGDGEGMVALRLVSQLEDQMKAHRLFKEQRMISLGWKWTESDPKSITRAEVSVDRQQKGNRSALIQLPTDTPQHEHRYSSESKDNNMYFSKQRLQFGDETHAAGSNNDGQSFGDIVRNQLSDSSLLAQSSDKVLIAELSEKEVRKSFRCSRFLKVACEKIIIFKFALKKISLTFIIVMQSIYNLWIL